MTVYPPPLHPPPLHPMADPGPSPGALALYRSLRRTGGSLRIGTLLKRATDADRVALCAAIDELSERYWITVILCKHAADTPGQSYPLDDIDRLRITRYGRRKYAQWTGR
ncbi:MAG: hypothetical protein K2X43_25680 [Hyphomonadaceae bacterium]|nr:hypothetical protein [Hyphomonadaceae bacterium]